MNRSVLLLAALCAAAVLAAAGWYLWQSDSEEEGRYREGLTEVVIANVSGASLRLYQAGPSLAGATERPGPVTGGVWLPPANYFLRYEEGGVASFIPIPLTGYRCGPDKDGSFMATVRATPTQFPPWPEAGGASFSYIPSGSMLLGDRHNPSERHYVWLTGYFIARCEATNRDFREFTAAPDGYGDDENWTTEGRRWKSAYRSAASSFLTPSDADFQRFGQPDQPVTMVTWYEANALCRWLTRRFAAEKWQFALPTDAEWEKAARGPDNFDYGLTMAISDAEAALYNWKKNPDAPVPVIACGAASPASGANRYGLYHMTGNVAEWTQSVNRPFSREHPYVDDDRNHDETEGLRTVRGGSWYSAAISYMYIPYRDSFQPEHRTRDIGFRIVARILP